MAVGIPTLLLAAGVGLQAVGQLQASQAAAAQAEGQQAMAEFNARVQEQQAKAIEARAEFRQQRQAKEAGRIASTLQAGLGAAGVVPSEGTPLLIQSEQAVESELENLLLGFEGEVGAARARSQAQLDRMQAQVFGQRAKVAGRAGLFGAGATLLTGFGQAFR